MLTWFQALKGQSVAGTDYFFSVHFLLYCAFCFTCSKWFLLQFFLYFNTASSTPISFALYNLSSSEFLRFRTSLKISSLTEFSLNLLSPLKHAIALPGFMRTTGCPFLGMLFGAGVPEKALHNIPSNSRQMSCDEETRRQRARFLENWETDFLFIW